MTEDGDQREAPPATEQGRRLGEARDSAAPALSRALAALKEAGAALGEAGAALAAGAIAAGSRGRARLAEGVRAFFLRSSRRPPAKAGTHTKPAKAGTHTKPGSGTALEPRGDLFDDAPQVPSRPEPPIENRGATPPLAAERQTPMPADPPVTAPKGKRLAAPARRAPARATAAGPMIRGLIADIGWLAGSLALTGAAGALFVAFVLIAPRAPDDADLWAANRQTSIVILDRNGDEIAARGARYGERVAVADLPPYLVQAFLATEDRRFYEHRGVDLRGTARAFMTNLKRGGVVEGGSTITQQLARNLFLSLEQTYVRKAREALLALWLEGRYSKDEILSLYLNRIYLGAGAYGIESASKTYFNKSARDVSLSEAVMLAGLPKAPSSLAPTQNPAGARKRADDVLQNLVETGAITDFEAREAKKHPPVISGGNGDADLGWFFDYIAAKAREMSGGRTGDLIVTTTLDAKMQRDAQAAVAAVISTETKLAGAEQAALIAYDANGALRAMVGGVSYVESQFNRATQARRQPGSTLKPFIYGMAFEDLLLHPQTMIDDTPTRFGDYMPSNFDEDYHGRLTVREALQRSLNLPAVAVLDRLGPTRLAARLRQCGVTLQFPGLDPVAPLPLALGGVGTTLWDLTGAYAAIANGGAVASMRAVAGSPGEATQRDTLMSPAAAWYITDILAEVSRPDDTLDPSFRRGGARIAYKTGTSYGYRDAWAIGYDARTTIGVWVGRPDGNPVPQATGHETAAPILFQAFGLLPDPGRGVVGPPPEGVIDRLSDDLPARLVTFSPQPGPVAPPGTISLSQRLRIDFPIDGSIVELPASAGASAPLPLVAAGGERPFVWMINGVPIETASFSRQAAWLPDSPGQARITVIDANGDSVSAQIWIQ